MAQQWTTGDVATEDKMNQLCMVGADADKGSPVVAGQGYFAVDVPAIYFSTNGSTWDTKILLRTDIYCLFARPSRLYAADGETLKQLNHETYSYQASPLDGDIFQINFFARGGETLLSLGCWKKTTSGKFDIYVNGILDSSAYDNYAASPAVLNRYITLTQPIVAGYNLIELKLNGKHASSGGYDLSIYGASLQ